MTEWQTIEKLPHDRTNVILYDSFSRDMCIGYWYEEGPVAYWIGALDHPGFEPSHFMSLPEPPTE